jgi:hypothetical protein
VASHGGGSYLGSLAEGLQGQAELGLVHLRHAGEGVGSEATWSWQGNAAYSGLPGGVSHRLRMLWRWRNRPLLAAKYWQPELVERIDAARREFAPDVALVELSQMAQYLPALRGVPTVFTDHEAGHPANARTGLGAAADRRDARLWRRYIHDHYRQATAIQAVTQEDADALAQQIGREVSVRPPTLQIPDTACQPGAAPKTALFLGDYRHGPNPEAATRLATEVWPLIRKVHPDAELLLAGPHEAPIRSLDELPGVRVIGFVPDLAELLGRVRVVLAPLWSGGGFRVKNATALAHGIPVVTNEIGSRGCLADDPACIVAETANGLAKATMRHLASAEFANTAGIKARQWAQAQYAPTAIAQLQLERLEQLLR